MYNYAQIDANGVVVGISQLAGQVAAADMVLLDGTRENDGEVGPLWRLAGGEWLPPVPETDADADNPVSLEELKEYTLLNMQLMLEAIELLAEGGE